MEIKIIERPSLINLEKPILSSNDIFIPRFFVNTQLFREPALHFMKYGKYCRARAGTKEWKDYWDLQSMRCRNGYKVGDLWIPGKYYFYLNFIQISAVPCRDYLRFHPRASKTKKVKTFPAFWEVDLRWWYTKELSEQNSENAIENCHLVCLKTRRGGFSYKEAVEGIWNFTFLNNTSSAYYAFSDAYLIKDGIFNKVDSMLNFINEHTYWGQARLVTDNAYDKIGSYPTFENGRKIIKGRKNQLVAQVVDNPEKVRGGDKIKITIEEFGSFKNGIEMWTVAMPQVKQGSTITGFMTAIGTGTNSENDLYIEGMEELFYNPDKYDCIAFDNIWDEGMEGTECGFFVPTIEIRTEFADLDGNLNREAALEQVLKERKKQEGTKAANGLIIENPLNPREALTRIHHDLFDVEYAKGALRRLETDGRLDLLLKVKMTGTFTDPQYMIMSNSSDYTEYPVRQEHDKDSCVVIKEQPYRQEDGKTPHGMYFMVHDPYSKDETETSQSIGSCYVIKRTNRIDNTPFERIVAWYHGRPKTRLEFNKQMFLLACYYNAMIQFEIDGGGQGVVEYARNSKHNLVHMLYTEPDMLHNKEVAGRGSNKGYGVKMGVGNRAKIFLEYLSDLLMTEIGITEDGQSILFIDTIDDIGFLKEVTKYKDGANVDRLSSARLMAMMIRELEAIQVEARNTNPNSFFNRPLYDNSGSRNTSNYSNVSSISTY